MFNYVNRGFLILSTFHFFLFSLFSFPKGEDAVAVRTPRQGFAHTGEEGNSYPLWSLCCEFRLPFPGSIQQVPSVGRRPAAGGWWGAHWDTGLLILLLFVAPPYRRERAPVITDRTAAHGVSAFLQPPATQRREDQRPRQWRGWDWPGVCVSGPRPPPAPSSPPSLRGTQGLP